jgi:hypothetical protein
MATGLTSVVTWQPPATAGGPLTEPRWLGQLANVNNLVYSYQVPGGPNQLTCNLMREPNWRTDALNPGRVVQAYRGGQCIWDGKLLEGVPSTSGWQLTATGLGNAPEDFCAIYTTWTNQNDAVNQAISRGLRISNPGITSGVWLGQQVDSGAQQISDLLNLFCTLGGYTWYISVNPTNGGGQLSVYAFPQGVTGAVSPLVPNRLLSCTAPVPRTLGGDINTVFLRYQTNANNSASPTYGVAEETVPASILAHGPVEAFEDISSVGYQTLAQTQSEAATVLSRYIRASFSGSFTVHQGEIMTVGGQPVDIGMEPAGNIYQALITDYGYGGEVVPGPVTFMAGAYSYDDTAQTAQITPYQSVDMSLTGMLQAITTWAGGATGTRKGGIGGTAGQESKS